MSPGASLAGLRPPKVPGLNFTAVDFETANGFRGSPCAIGLVRVRDGNVDELYFRRMRPPAGYDRFDPRNVAIHGITAERVAAEPRFAEIFSEAADFIGGDTLVAHNAAFDVEVFESSLEVSGLDSPGLRSLCTVRLARAVYRLDSHALPAASAAAGFHLKHHHHALWDARAAAAIVVDIAQREKVADLHALFGRHFIEPEVCEPWQAPRDYESRATRQIRSYGSIFDAEASQADLTALPDLMRWQDEGRNADPNPDADPDHPLCGQHLVFTGTIGVPRPQAKELAAAHGAATSSRVTGSTTLVVVGDGFAAEDLAAADRAGPSGTGLPKGSPLNSRKARQALDRRDRGQQIQFLTETQFRQLVGDAWPADAPSPAEMVSQAR